MTNNFLSTGIRLNTTLSKALLWGVSLLAMSCTNQTTDTALNADAFPPTGLWVWQSKTPQHEATLTVEQSEDGWIATLNSDRVNLSKMGQEITFDGPNGQTFSASLSQDQKVISGFWKQPFTSLGYSTIVTKVELQKTQTNTWTGKLIGQPRPFHIFLEMFNNGNGGVEAVIRNPERNEIMRATRFRVKSDQNNRWLLQATRRGTEITLPVTRLSEQRLKMAHSRFVTPITLKPASDEQKKRYYSRYQREIRHQYRKPKDQNDGWTVISANEAGFDEGILTELVTRLATADPREVRPNLIHSMLVAQKGRLLFEEYFFGHDENTVHDTRSLAKVFGSVMLGAMQVQGIKTELHAPLLESILQRGGKTLNNPQKSKIHLAHLLTYSSGLDCNVASRSSRGEEDNMWSQQDEPDFWLYTAQLPLLYSPGERYAYCSGSSNLVGATIASKMHMPVYEAFDTLIGAPLQFAPYHWNLMPNGQGYLGGGVYMRPRDILKLGAVYTDNGKWNGKRIVHQDWIDASTTTKIPISPKTTGMSEQDFANNYFPGGQAYIWRTDKVKTSSREYDSYEATGNGGQILLVVPELALSVVFTGGNYMMGSIWGRWRNELVGGYVIPALTGTEK